MEVTVNVTVFTNTEKAVFCSRVYGRLLFFVNIFAGVRVYVYVCVCVFLTEGKQSTSLYGSFCHHDR